MNIKKALTEENYNKINIFFWVIWKKEFNLDRFDRINEYKKWVVYYIEKNNSIIAALNLTLINNKKYIWRFATLKEYRRKWIWTLLLNNTIKLLKEIWEKEIFIYSEINNIKYYEKFWFVKIWKTHEIWNTQSIEMKINI